MAEIHGPAAGRQALLALYDDTRMTNYPFYWGALAEMARREGDAAGAARFYARAMAVSRSRAERTAYERTLRSL
jgi:predicted RNA polymerase sigma factor